MENKDICSVSYFISYEFLLQDDENTSHKPLCFLLFLKQSGTHGFISLLPLQTLNLAFKAKTIIEQNCIGGKPW